MFPFVRAFYYTFILARKPLKYIGLTAFFVLADTFLVTGIIGTDLVVMVPLSLFLRYISRIAHMSLGLKIIAVFMCLLLHTLIIDVAWIGLPIKKWSILIDFLTASFVVYLMKGSQGNRS